MIQANVQKYLAGVQYPASKQDVIDAAEQNGAPQEVMTILQNLSSESFASTQEIMKAYGRAGTQTQHQTHRKTA